MEEEEHMSERIRMTAAADINSLQHRCMLVVLVALFVTIGVCLLNELVLNSHLIHGQDIGPIWAWKILEIVGMISGFTGASFSAIWAAAAYRAKSKRSLAS